MYRKRSAALSAALLVSLTAATPAGADELAPQAAGTPGTVTLITGDRVNVTGDQVSNVRMAPGREQLRAWRYRLNGHDHVVPQDAVADLQAGKLDPRLFDVTGLVQQGYDDRTEPAVPTIVTGTAARALTSAVNAVYIPKTEAAARWRDRGAARLAAPEKIWLNGRVRASLDQSVKQIGAPAAWQAGFRGDGVKVAVLDSGYDQAHPDLKSVVDGSADFTGEGVQDTDGHGTHVASTIAGSGAASQGRYQGVAPGAKLLVGKVLGEFGGREDWIVNGMRWAVEQGADVVNMSLGSNGPGDGTDLMSQAINELSESSGTLFVVAAGNSGRRESVGSPAAADRALSVANVTKQDRLNLTSSQGPRYGDFGLKPEISAPGTDIVAARAAGTWDQFAVGTNYAQVSGTSMSSPHVAGAAAILAQQHPDWTGEQIKNALIGSSKRLPGISTFAQGAGRLDVARAVAQQVRVEGTAGFGALYGSAEAKREIRYVNSGTAPVTLALELDTNNNGLFTVPKSVVVPAGGTTVVELVARPGAQPPGEVTGALLARAGDVVLTTPVTGQFNAERRTLTVKVPSRSGTPFQSLVIAQDERTGVGYQAFTDTDVATFTVPRGTYRVIGYISDFTAGDTMFAQRADVANDTTIDANTKAGRPVTVGVDDPDARAQLGGGFGLVSDPDESGPLEGAAIVRGGGVPREGARLYSVAAPAMRGLSLTNLSYFNHPWALTTIAGAGGFEIGETYFPWAKDFSGTYTGRLVAVGEADRASIDAAGDVSGAIAVITPKNWDDPVFPPDGQVAAGVDLLKQRGARAVLSHFTTTMEDGRGAIPALPLGLVFNAAELRRIQDLMTQRTVEATMSVRPNSPVSYFLAEEVKGLPGGYDFQYAKSRLGRFERRLIDTMPAETYRFGSASWTFGGMRAGADVESKWPQRRTDYVSPGAGVTLFDSGSFLDNGDLGHVEITSPVPLKAGEKRTSRVFAAPFGPELTTQPVSSEDGRPIPWAYRKGDRISLMVPMFADSDPGTVSSYNPSNSGTTVVSKDGREIARGDRPALGSYDIPAGPGWLTLTTEASRPTGNMTPALSPKVRSEWRFHTRSGTDERVALPLLDIRYALELDDHNTAHGAVRGTVSVAHQPGVAAAKARSLEVEVSFDDGASWQRVRVNGNGKLEIPAGPKGFASLRAKAVDLLGNSVTETNTRAYAVR
ncbi:S8 family serine peptidase [Lentzea sp. NPDC058450]|uniref:S8 family peptidase n=1 Tax=Lentzea sp. NPDC058450 TaxID=3346505 RepID=UPI00364DAE0E